MPKRKSPDEDNTTATRTSGAEAVIASSNPRKKSKGEAIDAAKKLQGDEDEEVVRNHIPAAFRYSEEGEGAATPEFLTTNVHSGRGSATNATRLTEQPIPNKNILLSPPFNKVKSSKCNEQSTGNSFLKFLRKEKTSADASNETKNVSLGCVRAPTNASLPILSTSYVARSTNDNTSPGNQATKKCIHNRKMIVGRSLALLCLLALNIAAAVFLYDQSSNNSFQDEQHILELEKIKSEILKSSEVEEVLRSGIMLLEQQTKARTDYYLNEVVPSMYDMQPKFA